MPSRHFARYRSRCAAPRIARDSLQPTTVTCSRVTAPGACKARSLSLACAEWNASRGERKLFLVVSGHINVTSWRFISLFRHCHFASWQTRGNYLICIVKAAVLAERGPKRWDCFPTSCCGLTNLLSSYRTIMQSVVVMSRP